MRNPSTISVRCSRICSRSRSVPNSPYKTAKELFAAARDKGLNFGHAGLGSIPHLSVENLADATEGEGAASAVSRRRRHAAGADQGRSRFRRAGDLLDPRQRPDPSAGGVFRQAPSGLSGCADGERTRRQDRGAARPERPLRAEGLAGGREGGARARLRQCGEVGRRAEGDRQYRSEHRLSRRQAIPRSDRRRLQVQGRTDQAARARRASNRARRATPMPSIPTSCSR